MTKSDFDKLTIDLAKHILNFNTTIRATAKAFNIPKSTVHHILNTNLKHVDYAIYRVVKKHLINNFNIKHIHGGEATKKKYEKLKQVINLNDEIEFQQRNI